LRYFAFSKTLIKFSHQNLLENLKDKDISVSVLYTRVNSNTWKIAFFFSFIALLVDGADFMLLSYSLNSIKHDFGLTSVEAGLLSSITLAGMAIGGAMGVIPALFIKDKQYDTQGA
jgi:hypothetical protein